MKIETGEILNNPHARQAYYDELRKRRSGASEQKSETAPPAPQQPPSRAAELLEQLQATPVPGPRFKLPAAEAFIAETWPDVANSETAPTMEAYRRLSQFEFYRLKAARARLKELGIK